MQAVSKIRFCRYTACQRLTFVTNIDSRVIQQARQGDQVALGNIYDCLYPSVFRYIYYRVSDQETAEDLAAEVFVRMVERIGAYEQRERPILAWLYTIARNLVTDYYRLQDKVDYLPLEERLIAGEIHQPSQVAESRQARDCLARALEYLTEDQRQVILLKFVEDLEIAEVADLLGKNERAIRSLQHRALAAMNRAIEKERCYEF
jgi:RNA polymerase sigma-70 factor (ECF subfamily)